MKFSFAVLLMAGIFTLQTFDIPPARQAANPKTCCGRVICLCKHAPGVSCPMKSALKQAAGKKHCHLPKAVEKAPLIPGKNGFTKAPCSSDTPKSVLTSYPKDFLFTSSANQFHLKETKMLPSLLLPPPLSLRDGGIERPPKIF